MARPRKNAALAVEPVVSDALQLTPEETQAILALRQRAGAAPAEVAPTAQAPGLNELASALVQAIEATRPPSKKTIANRKRFGPGAEKDGAPKIPFKRPMYQHGMEILQENTKNEIIERLNKIKPGLYCNGWIRVTKRRSDGGYNIEYPVKTNSQRLKLINTHGITSFKSLLDRLISEKANPAAYKNPDEDDD